MNKSTLRQQFREIRKNISDKENLSAQICEIMQASEIYKSAKTPVFYWATKNEVSLSKILKERKKNGEKVILPRCLDKTGEMEFFETNLEQMSPDCQNIASPTSKNIILPSSIDVIFVPALAFDKTGNRLGQGGGYYDRYLTKCKNAARIGVGFFAQITEDTLLTDDLDVKMDYIISEKGIIKC